MKDPYRILGVSRNASQDEIKKAYRKLALELHPDSNRNNLWAEEDFKELSAAYDLLSHPEKRTRHDHGETNCGKPKAKPQGNQKSQRGRQKNDAKTGPFASSHGDSGGEAKDEARNPFESFFRKRSAREQAGVKEQGSNVSYTLKVEFQEAVLGVTKRINIANGKRLDVRVPPGTKNGQTLRLKGQGTPGAGSAAGDALVTIVINQDQRFRIEGDDIHSELNISLPEALLGAKVEAATIDGVVTLSVPAGSNTGALLRLKGKGIGRDGKERGDHYVKLLVTLPAAPDKELTEFVKKWGAKHPYAARNDQAKAD